MSSRLVVLPFERPTSPRSKISRGGSLSASLQSSTHNLKPKDHELLLKLRAIRADRPRTARLLENVVDDLYAEIVRPSR